MRTPVRFAKAQRGSRTESIYREDVTVTLATPLPTQYPPTYDPASKPTSFSQADSPLSDVRAVLVEVC